MGEILKKAVPGWDDLNITTNGEAILNYCKDGHFILTKVRAQKAILSLSDFRKQLPVPLASEVKAILAYEKAATFNGEQWYVDCYNLSDSALGFYHFCYTERDGYYFVLQSALDSTESISCIEENLEMLLCAINFTHLQRESASLENRNGVVRVSAVSDFQLCVAEDNFLFFVGKESYVAVTLKETLSTAFVQEQDSLVHSLRNGKFDSECLTLRTSEKANRACYSILGEYGTSGHICCDEKLVSEGLVLSTLVYSRSLAEPTPENLISCEVSI